MRLFSTQPQYPLLSVEKVNRTRSEDGVKSLEIEEISVVSVDIDSQLCTGCGICVENCPSEVLYLSRSDKETLAAFMSMEDCCACGTCAIKCPEHAIVVTGYQMLKTEPPPEYPPEEGRYMRGNDFSPVAVVAILDTPDDNIPPELTKLVTTAIESGAALAGTLQTENIGIEKIVANIVANPNIRYLVLCWREAEGHRPAEALECLVENGVADDKRRTIRGASAMTPYLANLSPEAIERFRRQVFIANLIREDDASFAMRTENVQKVVHACIQEKPTEFEGFVLYDPGAWPEPPICEKLSRRLTEPWRPEIPSDHQEVLQRMKDAASSVKPTEKKSESSLRKQKEDNELMLEFLGLKKREDEE